MDAVLTQLTVYFDDPFWIGVVERYAGNGVEAAKVVFGAEPKDYDVYRLMLESYGKLRFSPAVESERPPDMPANPKWVQRDAARQLARTGVGTRAQQAIKLQHEQAKTERRTYGKQERDEAEERRFQLRQDKRKQKHKGR